MTEQPHDADDRIINALADRIRSDDAHLDYADIPALADLLTESAYLRLIEILARHLETEGN